MLSPPEGSGAAFPGQHVGGRSDKSCRQPDHHSREGGCPVARVLCGEHGTFAGPRGARVSCWDFRHVPPCSAYEVSRIILCARYVSSLPTERHPGPGLSRLPHRLQSQSENHHGLGLHPRISGPASQVLANLILYQTRRREIHFKTTCNFKRV